MNEKVHQEIIYWLKGDRNFKQGVELYQSFGGKKKLIKRFLRSGPNDYNQGLLKSEIEMYARLIEKQIKATKAQQYQKKLRSNVPPPPDTNSIDFVLKPVEIQEVETKKYISYMNAHIARFKELPAATTDEQRAAIVEKVVTLMQENQKYWDILNAYNKSGKLPPKPEPEKPKEKPSLEGKDPVLMQKTITNRRSNISNYRRYIKQNPEHASIAHKKTKIQEWEQEIKELENELKSLTR